MSLATSRIWSLITEHSLVALLSIVLAGVCTGHLLRGQPSGYRPGRTPVTITFFIAPAYGPCFHEIEYYRADGSYAQAILRVGDTQVPQVSVVDVAEKRNFLKDPLTNLYDQVPFTQRLYDGHRFSPTACEATISSPKQEVCAPVGEDRVAGYRVQKRTTTITQRHPGVSEEWLAPDLNFLSLRRVLMRNGKVTMTRTAVSVQVGDPDKSVFALPSNFRKVANSSEWIAAGEVARGRRNTFSENMRREFDQAQRDKRDGAQSSTIR
jgi:hypothetical protein